MTESAQMLRLILALISLGLFTWFYSRGGRANKYLRRYVGSALFVAGCSILAAWSGKWSWWMIFAYPAYALSLSMGYGGESFPARLMRRLVYGSILGVAAASFLLPLGLYNVWLFQEFLAISVSVFMGLNNPISAVGEEGSISLLSVSLIPFALI